MLAEPTIIALLGAECTGKSTLVAALASSLVAAGIDAVAVPEYLREFCATHGRTPGVAEQLDIACEQSSRISRAAERHAVVVADTTAFMTAVYSEALFGDTSLYADAASAHRDYRLTLLTGLEIPWVADGLQRDGALARARLDARLRVALLQRGVPFAVLVGDRAARLRAAVRVVQRCLAPPPALAPEPRWHWVCEHCGDGVCEAATKALSR